MLLVAVVAIVVVPMVDVVALVVSCGQKHSGGDSGLSQSHSTGTSIVVVTVEDVDVVATTSVVGMHADSIS